MVRSIPITGHLAMAAAQTNAVSRAEQLLVPTGILVVVKMLVLQTGFGDQLQVDLEASNDLQNWTSVANTTVTTVGVSSFGTSSNLSYGFVRLRYTFTNASGTACIVAADLKIEDRTSSAMGAPPAPPV